MDFSYACTASSFTTRKRVFMYHRVAKLKKQKTTTLIVTVQCD